MIGGHLKRITFGRVLRNQPIRDYLWMTFGVLLTACVLNAFLIPNRLAAGGVSGLATILYHTARDLGVTLPVGLQMLVMSIVLLALAVRVRGRRYAAKTVYGIVALSVFVDLLAPVTSHLAEGDYLLAALCGGTLSGIGIETIGEGFKQMGAR